MTMLDPCANLRACLGLRQETPEIVYDPISTLFFDADAPDLATIRAVAREAGAAGWLQHGVTLGSLVTRFDGLRRRGAFHVPSHPLAASNASAF